MKVLRFIIFSVCLSSVAYLLSCSPHYYYPTQQNVLKFKEQGDATLSATADAESFSYNASYALTDNVGVITSFYTFDLKNSEDDPYQIDDYLLETELVFFKKMDGNFYPAVNIGYGFGELDRFNQEYELGVKRQFLQPSMAFSSKFVDFALSSRITRVNYDLSIIDNDQYAVIDRYDLRDVGQTTFYFVEPGVTLGLGYKGVKLRAQTTFAHKLSRGEISYIQGNIILGFNATF